MPKPKSKQRPAARRANSQFAIAIMAAGKGTRLKSKRPKVLHEVGGQPLLAHVIAAATQVADPRDVYVIIGHEAEKVRDVESDLAARQSTASDSSEIAGAHAKASEKIADAQEKSAKGIAKAQTKIDEADAKLDEAVATWHDAEREVRYGYTVRSRYPANSLWDGKIEKE